MAVAAHAPEAEAFSQDYCSRFVDPYPDTGDYCGHGNYNSIIYNRSNAGFYGGGNSCVLMVTAAGSLRGNGAVVCTLGSSKQARMCVDAPTPMSQGRTWTRFYNDYLDGVVNNLTYDSGCAV